jgi:hypothetical protein
MIVKLFTLGVSTLILLSCSNVSTAACRDLDSGLSEVFIGINEFLNQQEEDCSEFVKIYEPEPTRERLPNETDEEWLDYTILMISKQIQGGMPSRELQKCRYKNQILYESQNDEDTYRLPLINFAAKVWPSINNEDLKYSLKEIANNNKIEQNLLSIYTICNMDKKELP